jgi:hypothetical protein
LKPEFWTDEKVVDLSFAARLLFIGLWNLCDDHGRMEYSAKRIKLQIFPADRVDVAKICAELREKSMIQIYEVEGHEYLEVLNFRKHQQIKDGDRPSRFPDPPRADLRASAQDFAQISQEGKGKEGKGKEGIQEGKGSEVASPPPPQILADLWNQVCENLPKVRGLPENRAAKVRARMKAQPELTFWVGVFRKCNSTPFLMGHNDRGWKATFDWVIENDSNALKAIEGKYDGTGKPRTANEKARANLDEIERWANRPSGVFESDGDPGGLDAVVGDDASEDGRPLFSLRGPEQGAT